MTRKIYLLIHMAGTFTDIRKVLHAYESEAEAAETVERWRSITTGVLEIQPVELIGAVKMHDGWRQVIPQPSTILLAEAPGKAEVGRAELP